MPLERLALILFCVVTFAGVGLWLASLVVVSSAMHPLLAILPLTAAAFAAYFVIRIVAERVNNPDEDHYDKMEH
ncbi:MAG: hypothetical protein KJP02_04200 [Octadecabacter sp.]|nr:hypothetical protein [Octadecabacter sp.]